MLVKGCLISFMNTSLMVRIAYTIPLISRVYSFTIKYTELITSLT